MLDLKSGRLWEPARMTAHICEGAIHRHLDEAARKELSAIPDIAAKVATALKDPKPLDINMPVFMAVLAAQYFEVFEAIAPPRELSVYEPCVGASNPVIVASAAYSND